MRRLLLLLFSTVALAGSEPALAASGVVTSYPIPVLTTPYAVAVGPDGKIWFADTGNHAGGPTVGRMTAAGGIAAADVVPMPFGALAGALVAGPDGNMWVLQDSYVNRVPVGVMSTAQIDAFPLAHGTGGFQSIAVGPDNRLWHGWKTEVGTVTTAGALDSHGFNGVDQVSSIISGPGGMLWFGAGDHIVRMSTSGVIGVADTFTLPAGNHSVYGVANGPDGNVWFTQNSPAGVGRVTPAGDFKILPTPTANSLPFGIAAGPDGKMWFVENNGDNVASVPTDATSGADIKEYPVGHTNAGLESIVAGPDCRMWFNLFNVSALGAVTTDACTTSQPAGTTPPATTPPVSTPPATTPRATQLKASTVFTLPSAKTCVSRRSFRIRVRKLPGVTFVSAVVKVNGKRVKTVTRARITAPVDLKGLFEERS